MRNLIFLTGLIVLGLAITVAISHLSNEAAAVVVGAVCGISAAIPIVLALIAELHRARTWGREPLPPPQVIVRAARPTRFALGNTPLLPSGAPDAGAPRDFKIIGDEMDGEDRSRQEEICSTTWIGPV